MKKFLKITLITVLILIAILFTLPFLFKGKIISLVKSEINNNINARVDFADLDISLLKRFPKVSVGINKLQITGIGRFETDTLLSADKIEVAHNLMSVIRGNNMTIYSISVNQPRVHAIVAKNGQPNWDIMKPDTSTAPRAEEKPFNMELQRYSISNGYVYYIDSSADMKSEVFGLQHEGSGDFTANDFTLNTSTTADAVNFTYGPVPYLVNVKTKINAAIQVNNKTSKYTFKTDEIALNELKLTSDGFFQMMDSAYNMDIRFNAPSTDFKNILSLVPIIYQKDFAKVKTGGKAIFNGSVKGIYSDKKIPAYHVNLDVANGFFQYPDLPAPVKNINVSMKVDNPDGITDHTVVDISKAHFQMENDPFDFRLLLKTPVSDMWIDAAAKGKFDLGNVSRMVKLEQGTSIKGLLNADVAVKGFVDAVKKQQFDKFSASGTVAMKGFAYAAKDYPTGVALDNLLMTFNPRNVTINDISGNYLNTGFAANGAINNLIGYALKNGTLDGVVNVKADKINVNDWMGTDSTSQKDSSTATPFIVPANLDLLLNAQALAVKYDNLLLENVSGSLRIANEMVKMENIQGNALDGTIHLNGSYSTRTNKKKPAIALQYNVEHLDVQKTFNAFNTVQKLMPIGKFLAGKISSKLNLTGQLGSNMLPDLTTLTGDGNLLLIEGLLSKFKPLEQLADKLNVPQLQDISLKEIREQFEFNAGKVFVKPFKVKVSDIEMEIGGTHSFDQHLDYTINVKLPRAMMGAKGNNLLNNLASQATSRGVPVKLSEMVNVRVKMLGTITNPSIQLDLKQTATSLAEDIKAQAKEFVQAKIDSTKNTVRDTLQSLKNEALKTATDKLKDQLFNRKDSVPDSSGNKPSHPVDRLKESGKGLIENINPFKKKK